MMCYETTTTLAPAVALAVAEHFFGADIGMLVGSRNPRELQLEGSGGHVLVRVVRAYPTTLEIETGEWDTPVMVFLERLPR